MGSTPTCCFPGTQDETTGYFLQKWGKLFGAWGVEGGLHSSAPSWGLRSRAMAERLMCVPE